jgi:stage II sporulation protein AB (anti-sigma F factor)
VFATRRTFTRSYRAESPSVASARHDLADFAVGHGLEGDYLDALRTAVSEAVTNAVLHAYRDGPGDIHVTAAVTGSELWVLVADDGCGLQTPARTPGLGWGLALIANAVEELVLAERAEHGTEVRMRFTVPGG